MVRRHPLHRFAPAPPPPPAPRPRRFAAWCGIAIAAILATGVYFSKPVAESWLLARWKTDVAAYSADEATAAMTRAAESGTWGRRLLLAALASSNDDARIAAADTLVVEIERWKHEAALDHTDDITALARGLADASPQWTPLHTAALEPLILALTNWRLDSRAPGAPQFAADCETLVRTIQEQQPTRLAVAPREDVQPAFTAAPTAVPPAPVPSAPPPTIGSEDPPVRNAPPLAPTPVAPPAVSPSPPDREPSPDLILEMLPSDPATIRRMDQPPPIRRRSPPRDPASSAAAAMIKLTDWEVITLLHAENAIQTTAAEEELYSRGYRRPDLSVARRAADPNPTVRKRLAEELPRQTGVDARRWLLKLAEDPDGGVRSTAQGILKTARDPALRR